MLRNFVKKTFSIHFNCSRFEDKKDKLRLVSHAFPDNKSEDKYIYEVITFTGNWASASCDSKVQFY